MRLCIPTEGQGGLAARVSAHFGRAPAFAIVDTVTGDVETFENPERDHDHGRCAVTAHLADYALDGVACRAIGRHALESLQVLGIEVYGADGPSVGDVLEQARRSELRSMDSGTTCR